MEMIKRNDRRERLLQFLEQQNLFATNTFFKKRNNQMAKQISVTTLNQFTTSSNHQMFDNALEPKDISELNKANEELKINLLQVGERVTAKKKDEGK